VQAPVLSHPVAPQVASVVLHDAVQQLPVPSMPQTPEVHEAFELQAVPATSLAVQVPPLQ
jgi:hypothetical protein